MNLDDQLEMLLKTVIPIAGVALALGLMFWLLPMWLVGVLVVVALAVVSNPKARSAIKKALAPPPDVDSNVPPPDSTGK